MVRVTTGRPVDTVFPGRTAEIRDYWATMIVYALAIVAEQCSEDPIGLWEIFPITRIIERVLGCIQTTLTSEPKSRTY